MCCGCSFELLKKTVHCANGHRCCQRCYRLWRGTRLPSGSFAGTECPMCRMRGPFARAPDVDALLKEQACRCPHVRESTGRACRWTGRYADLPSHAHRFVGPLPPPPPRRQPAPAVGAPPPQPGRQQPPAVDPPPQRWTWVGPIDWFHWGTLIGLGVLVAGPLNGLYRIFQQM